MALPKWVFERYAKLWNKFDNKPFSHKQAQDFLKEPKPTTLSLVIQELKNAGWVTITLDPKDSRKRLYLLKEPNQVIKEMV
jgi:hypothetical protein